MSRRSAGWCIAVIAGRRLIDGQAHITASRAAPSEDGNAGGGSPRTRSSGLRPPGGSATNFGPGEVRSALAALSWRVRRGMMPLQGADVVVDVHAERFVRHHSERPRSPPRLDQQGRHNSPRPPH